MEADWGGFAAAASRRHQSRYDEYLGFEEMDAGAEEESRVEYSLGCAAMSTRSIPLRPRMGKVMDIFIKAAEYMEMPVCRSDDEPLQRLFVAVRSELNIDLKNIKTEQAKFWKQHPSLVKMELLIQAHLTRESTVLSTSLESDFRRMLELAPRLLEELMKLYSHAILKGMDFCDRQLVWLNFLSVSYRSEMPTE